MRLLFRFTLALIFTLQLLSCQKEEANKEPKEMEDEDDYEDAGGFDS